MRWWAAAVAAVYAFIIANFVYRDMGPFASARRGLLSFAYGTISVFWHEDTKKTLIEGGKLTVTLMFIIANALILKHVLTEEQIPQHIAQLMPINMRVVFLAYVKTNCSW